MKKTLPLPPKQVKTIENALRLRKISTKQLVNASRFNQNYMFNNSEVNSVQSQVGKMSK